METKFERPLPFEFNNHLSINKNNFPCKICSRICQSKFLLARHVSTVHEGKNPQVVQPSQNTVEILDHDPSFLSEYDLEQSWSPSTKTWSIKFKCPICFKILGNKATLKKHISKLHEKDKPFQCISCPTRFSFRNELERHFSRVHEGKEIDVQDTNDGKNYQLN